MQMIVPEIDVLIGCSLWLYQRGAVPVSFSIASGHGIDLNRDKQRLLAALESGGVSTSIGGFRQGGPDVIAISESEFWQIECKGAGQGKQSTQRNNFDRALASVVSYFTDQSPHLPGKFSILNTAKPFLGLALPTTSDYLAQLQKRVLSPLRKHLNLWVLLYDPKSHTIIPVSPDESYPEGQSISAGVNSSFHRNTNTSIPAEKSSMSATASSPGLRGSKRLLVNPRSSSTRTERSNSGESLNREWNVGARHALYHKDGTWYMPLERFPGAYFDPNGYVVFTTEHEYVNNPHLSIGERVNVRGGISRLPGYRKMR